MDGMLFSKVLHMSLIGCYSILIVLAVRFFLKKAGRKYCYYLWMIVFLNLCIPFSVFSSFSLIPKQISGFSIDTMEAGRTSTEQFSRTEDLADADFTVFSPNGTVNYRKDFQEVLPNITEPEIIQNQESSEVFTFQWQQILPWAEKIWLLGIAVFMLHSIYSVVRLKHRIQEMETSDRGRKKKIVELKGLEAPFLWGIVRPTIYLPTDMDVEERQYILAHETCHLKRKDHLLKILTYAVTVLHWFNPLVWFAYSLYCKDMEISCDEAVLEKSTNNIRKDYAQSLLKYAAKQNRYLMTPLTFGEPSVRSRIENVLKYRKKGVLVSVTAILITAFVAVGLFIRPEETAAPVAETEEMSEAAKSLRLPIVNNGGELILEESDDSFNFLTDPMPGIPCEDPTEAGWDLKNVEDIRENFSYRPYIPEPGTEEYTYLIGKTENYALYGKGDYESMLLECSGEYAEINYPYASNYMTPLELLEADLDRDGFHELAIKFNIKHGTGVSIDTFFLADLNEAGKLYVYQFLEEDYIAQLEEHLSYHKTEDGIYATVDGKQAGAFMANAEGMDPWISVGIGSQIAFYYTQEKIEISAELLFMDDEIGAVPWVNKNDITATVTWNRDGTFRLTDFTSRNRYLDYEVQEALLQK